MLPRGFPEKTSLADSGFLNVPWGNSLTSRHFPNFPGSRKWRMAFILRACGRGDEEERKLIWSLGHRGEEWAWSARSNLRNHWVRKSV